MNRQLIEHEAKMGRLIQSVRGVVTNTGKAFATPAQQGWRVHDPDVPTEVIPLLMFVGLGLLLGGGTMYRNAKSPDVAWTHAQEHGWNVSAWH